MRVGSLFTGIGGFDLAFEQAGYIVAWQCEINRLATVVLRRHWPDVACYDDIRRIADGTYQPAAVDLLCGGDPCPIRSRARGSRPSRHPDLAGYFLAVAGRFRPKWVVRENVPAPDHVHFAAGLECLGYSPVVVELNSAGFTGQSRARQFCIGCPGPGTANRLKSLLAESQLCGGNRPAISKAQTIIACLVAHPKRFHDGESYIYEPSANALRVLTTAERERLQGFPAGWVEGASFYGAAKLLGNAVTVPVARYVAELIREAA